LAARFGTLRLTKKMAFFLPFKFITLFPTLRHTASHALFLSMALGVFAAVISIKGKGFVIAIRWLA